MNHFIFLCLAIAFVSLSSWATTITVLYVSSRKRVLFLESLLALSMMTILGGLLLHFYCLNFIINIGLLPTLISFAGTLTILFTLPLFTYTLLGIDFTPGMKRLFFTNGIVYSTSLWFIVKTTPEELVGPFTADVSEISNLIIYIVYGLSFFGTLSHCFILGFIRGKAVGDKQLQKIRMTTFGVSLLFLIPLIVLSATGKTRAAVVCLSVMFLSISISNLYFSIFFANKPCYFSNSSLTAHFVSHFKISDREKEVIALLLEGMANKEIAEVLFISPRTVENHLSSVYQKAEVNSRIQLINLIRANASS